MLNKCQCCFHSPHKSLHFLNDFSWKELLEGRIKFLIHNTQPFMTLMLCVFSLSSLLTLCTLHFSHNQLVQVPNCAVATFLLPLLKWKKIILKILKICEVWSVSVADLLFGQVSSHLHAGDHKTLTVYLLYIIWFMYQHNQLS